MKKFIFILMVALVGVCACNKIDNVGEKVYEGEFYNLFEKDGLLIHATIQDEPTSDKYVGVWLFVSNRTGKDIKNLVINGTMYENGVLSPTPDYDTGSADYTLNVNEVFLNDSDVTNRYGAFANKRTKKYFMNKIKVTFK